MTCECLVCGKKKGKKSIKCRNVEMSRVEEELGLFAVRNVSSCITLACESHACRSTMEVLGEDEESPFLVKYTCFPRDHSYWESDRSKYAKLSEKSCKPLLFCLCIWMSSPWDALHSSSAAPGRTVLAQQRANPPLQALCWCSACSIALGRL